MLRLAPTKLSSPSRKKPKTRVTQKKTISRRRRNVRTFLESRQETGPKAETEEKTEEATGLGRHSNKTADRKMESNDSPEIQDRAETSEAPCLPSGKLGARQGTVLTQSHVCKWDLRRTIPTSWT